MHPDGADEAWYPFAMRRTSPCVPQAFPLTTPREKRRDVEDLPREMDADTRSASAVDHLDQLP